MMDAAYRQKELREFWKAGILTTDMLESLSNPARTSFSDFLIAVKAVREIEANSNAGNLSGSHLPSSFSNLYQSMLNYKATSWYGTPDLLSTPKTTCDVTGHIPREYVGFRKVYMICKVCEIELLYAEV